MKSPKKQNKKTCLVCAKPFTPKNYWQKYCSKECKFANWALSKVHLHPWTKVTIDGETHEVCRTCGKFRGEPIGYD